MDLDIIDQVKKALADGRRVTIADYHEVPVGPSLQVIAETERRVKDAQLRGERVIYIYGAPGGFPPPGYSVDRETAIELKNIGVRVERGGETADDDATAAFWSRLGG